MFLIHRISFCVRLRLRRRGTFPITIQECGNEPNHLCCYLHQYGLTDLWQTWGTTQNEAARIKNDKGKHFGNQHRVYFVKSADASVGKGARKSDRDGGDDWWWSLSDSKLGLQSGDQKLDNQTKTHADITRTIDICVIDRWTITRGGTIIYGSRGERETNFGMLNMDFAGWSLAGHP